MLQYIGFSSTLSPKEAELHTSCINIASNAIIASLVQRLLEHKVISAEEIMSLTDSRLEYELLHSPLTQAEYKRLTNDAWNLKLARTKEELPEEYYEWNIKKLYLSNPLIKSTADGLMIKLENDSGLQYLTKQTGIYYVYWQDCERTGIAEPPTRVL